MYTYIIVDDEPLIRRGMLKKLKSFSEELQYAGEADNGADALELIREVNPDIILTDMRMPEMDGKSFLKVLQNDFAEKKIIVISGYSDFEYMQEAISAKVVGYLLKPFNREEIHAALQKAIDFINRDRTYQQKLETTETEREEMKYQTDLHILNNIILGISKNFQPKSLPFQNINEGHHFVLFTIYSIAKLEQVLNDPEFIKDLRLNFFINIPNTQNENIYFFLFYINGVSSQDIQHKGNWLFERISCTIPSRHLYFGVSYPKETLLELNQAYRETGSALNNRLILDKNHIFTYDGKQTTLVTPKWEKTDELLFFIESGNIHKVRELTSDYFNYLCQMPSLTIASIKNLCNNMIHQVRNMLSNYFESIVKDSSSSSFESMLETTFDVDTIQSYFFQVLPSLAELFKEKNIYGSENLIDNIKSYITKNLDKELTLTKISTLFYINPSYCSYLFKEKTGENFIDYVNRVRIEKAKLMLKSSPEKVYKIAKSLGYDNSKYFFRVFKKATGYTPEKYRTM